jgi:Protein of unknown function (DUF3999)
VNRSRRLSTLPRQSRATLVGIVACILALGIVFGSVALGAATAVVWPQAWRTWSYSREIIPPAANERGLTAIVVPEDVYAHSSKLLADIRIVDDAGREVPYVLHVPSGHTHTDRRIARMQEHSFRPGEFTQFVLDANANAPFHNALLVNTSETDFITWAEVAVSDDARQWRIVCDRAPLFRFNKQNLQGTQTLHYSETNARYIRLRILEGSHPFPVTSVNVLYEVTTPEERVPVSAQLHASKATNPQESVWRADLPADLPLNEVHFETDESEFSRSVTIDSSEDGQEWTPVGSGEIYRFHHDDVLREWLQVGFGGGWSLHWRVHVMNGDNSPLAAARVILYMTPRRLVFRADPARRYLLVYGQSEAKPPQYDLERTIRAEAFQKLPVATLGGEQINSEYEDPRPWSERHPAVLWIAVIIAAGLLGAAALRSLRASR